MLDVRYDLHHGVLKTLSQNQVRARTNPTHHSNTGTANSRPSRVQGLGLAGPRSAWTGRIRINTIPVKGPDAVTDDWKWEHQWKSQDARNAPPQPTLSRVLY